MKKVFTLLCVLVYTHTSIIAQLPSTITIGNSKFRVELNKQDKTAKIVDYYHEIEDAEFPFKITTRKLAHLDKNKTLVIPDNIDINGEKYTIIAIGNNAFADYTNFKFVKIPETVVTIGDYAFFRTSLQEVEIPACVTYIGDRAFGYCEKLKRLVLPQNVAMGNQVYEENKKTTVQFYDNTAIAIQPQAGKDEFIASTPTVINSDIDENIPLSTHSAASTFAIIIANENYQNDPAVDFALRDGRTFKTYCQQVLGIPAENIRYQENATLNNMRMIVNWISQVAEIYDGESRFLFYYSGHGTPDDDGNTCLLPVDGSAKDPTTGYSLNRLYNELGRMNIRNIYVFLDACFSGTQRNEEMLVAARGVRRAIEAAPKGNMVIFSAAKEDETAHTYPEKGHGLFTYFLCKKLKETKGNVTLGELSDYIEENVLKRSIVILDKTQTPTTNPSPKLISKWRNLNLSE